MLASFRARATYANVVSTICLFILLGGGAYAASRLSKDSVGASQIKRNAVRTAEVKNSSLRADDFKPGELPTGPPGAPGAGGTARGYGVISASGTLNAAQSKGITVTKITAQTGAYCVRPEAGTGIDPAKVRPIVSADLSSGSGSGSVHIAQISTATFYPAECPAAAGWEIYTQLQNVSNVFVNADLGFSILIP